MHVQADPVRGREPPPVAEQHRQLAPALLDPLQAEVVRDTRVLAVRAQDPARPQLPTVVEQDSADRVAVGGGADEPRDLAVQQHGGAALLGQLDEGGVQGHPAHRQRPVMPPDRREAAGDLVAQHPPGVASGHQVVPALEALQNAEVVQPRHPVGEDHMGGQRVAGEPRLVDDGHSPATAGQPEGEGGAGAAGPHDHGIERGRGLAARRAVEGSGIGHGPSVVLAR